ncbi:hypothetical protein WICPIJ_002314 [Wickerhamomyces pijperi]|uniref:Arrestin-like N-terminal domain-containing protein n=1 Tax=Wickerhamomyces pijperi TaxID=599730 RepID=A0A9P8Q9D9_WICPI|nr:hypothetical protein WICPIJ_002314 [Wickerhamomyces pijperi]
MSCSVDLQIYPPSPTRTVYVPLDIIQGRAIIKVHKEIAVTNIQIKLLGQTFTTITKQVIRRDGKARMQSNEESHEVVYDVDTVFPPDDIKRVSKTPQFTLTPGEYSYDFKFQLPLNSACGDPESAKIYSNRLNSPIEKLYENTHNKHGVYAGRNVTHLMSPLPPSCKGSVLGLSGMDGYGVKYEVKCTVRRASMFKTNVREIKRIVVLPFEFGTDGLRSVDFQTQEVIVQKTLTDECSVSGSSSGAGAGSSDQERVSGFKKFFRTPNSSNSVSSKKRQLPVKVNVEFTNNYLLINSNPIKSMSLSVNNIDTYVGKGSDSSFQTASIFLRSMSIVLKSQTNFKSQEFNAFEQTSSEIFKLDRINYEIKLIPDETGSIPFVLSRLFDTKQPLIPVVPPSFQTCSMIRGYWLDFEFQFTGEPTDTKPIKLFHRTGNILISSGIPIPPSANINVNFLPPAPPNDSYSFDKPMGPPPSKSTDDFDQTVPSYQAPSGPPPSFSPVVAESSAAREKREVEEWYAKNQHLYEQGTSSSAAQQASSSTGTSSVSVQEHSLIDFDSNVVQTPQTTSSTVENSTQTAAQLNQINQQLNSMGIHDNNEQANAGEQLPSYQEATGRRR